MPSYINPLYIQQQQIQAQQDLNLAEITEQAAKVAENAERVQANVDGIQQRADEIGAQSSRVESALGQGETPAKAPKELYGVYPLFHFEVDAITHFASGSARQTTINGIDFFFPNNTPDYLKGHHDSLRVPIDLSLAPATTAAAFTENPVVYEQLAFDNMFVKNEDGSFTRTQNKELKRIDAFPTQMYDLYDCAVDLGEWVEPGVLGYRLHITDTHAYLGKYSHPSNRTREYIVGRNEWIAFRGGCHVHGEQNNVLVLTQEPALYGGSKGARFNKMLTGLLNADGQSLIEAKLIASGKSAGEATTCFNAFKDLLTGSSIPVDYDTDSRFTTVRDHIGGLLLADQTVFSLIFDYDNHEVSLFEQHNTVDEVTYTPDVEAVINVLLEDTPIHASFEGSKGKYENRIRSKRFPRQSKLTLKKIERTQDVNNMVQEETDRINLSRENAKEDAIICKWKQLWASVTYFSAMRDASPVGTLKSYLTQKVIDCEAMRDAMSAQYTSITGGQAVPPVPTQVSFLIGNTVDLLGMSEENGKIVCGYSLHSSRVVPTPPINSSGSSYVPAYSFVTGTELQEITDSLDSLNWNSPLITTADLQNVADKTVEYWDDKKTPDVNSTNGTTTTGVYNAGFTVLGNSTEHVLCNPAGDMLAHSPSPSDTIVKGAINEDCILPVFSLSKMFGGFVGALLSQELEGTKGGLQMNAPIGVVSSSNDVQSAMTCLKNTTYKVLQRTPDTTQVVVIPAGRVNAGDTIAEALADKSVTTGETTHTIVAGKFYTEEQLLGWGFVSGDYTTSIHYELRAPSNTLTPAHLFSQTTGQAILNITYWNSRIPDQEFAGFPFNLAETKDLIELMYGKTGNNLNYPDDIGLTACSTVTPEPVQTSILVADPGVATYGGGMYAAGYYLHQNLYAKVNDIPISEVSYTTLFNSGYNYEAILYKYLLKDIINSTDLLTNVSAYLSVNELLDPGVPSGSPPDVMRQAFTDVQKDDIKSRYRPAALMAGEGAPIGTLHVFNERWAGMENSATQIFYNAGSNVQASIRFVIEFAQFVLRRGEMKNSSEPLINVEEPFVTSSLPVMNKFMYEKQIGVGNPQDTFVNLDFFEGALTIPGIPYGWGHAFADKVVHAQNACGYGQLTPILAVVGANCFSLYIYPEHGVFSLMVANIYPAADDPYREAINLLEKTTNKQIIELGKKFIQWEKIKVKGNAYLKK